MQTKSATVTNASPATQGRIVETRVYKFSELSDSAKEKARQWWREGQCGDNFWSESTIDEAIEQGKLMGITFKERQVRLCGGGTRGEPRIYWSGFYSQGDGACFEGTWCARDVKANKVAEGWGEDPATTEIKRIAAEFARISKDYPEASFAVTHSGHYQHENCTEFDFHFPDDNDGEDWPEDKRTEWDAECEALKETARDFMRWIYRWLEKEYEYQNSDECVDENIECNEYEFTEDGNRF